MIISNVPKSASGATKHSPSGFPVTSHRSPSFERSRSSVDGQPPIGFPPSISPNAPRADQELFRYADCVTGGTVPGINARTSLMLRHYGVENVREDFVFRGQPATVHVNAGRMVTTVGSDEDGTAGQVILLNGRIQTTKGVANDPETQLSILRYTGLALCAGVARRQNMPIATAALDNMHEYLLSMGV